MGTVSSDMKVNKNQLICGIVILIALISGQTSKLFGISSGAAFQLFYYSKFFASFGLMLYAISGKKKKVSTTEIRDFLKSFYPLILLMVIVEIIAMPTSPAVAAYGARYYTRVLSNTLSLLCIWMTVAFTWALCGRNAVKCLTAACIADEVFVLIRGLIDEGVSGLIQSFAGALSITEGSSSFFEVHELTFCMGLLLIYYLFFSKERKVRLIILLAICFVLGEKRIGFAGIAAAGIFSFVVKKKGLSKRMLTCVGAVGVVICLLYLAMIYNDDFFALLAQYGINNMGRDLIFGYFTRRTVFSPSQLGWGLAGVAKVVENMDRAEVYYMAAVRGLHNDILKIYINYGFFGSILWYSFNLLYLPRRFFHRYGKKVATLFMSLSLYMFVTYLTDNTEGYYVCQIAFLLIPLSEYVAEKSLLSNE